MQSPRHSFWSSDPDEICTVSSVSPGPGPLVVSTVKEPVAGGPYPVEFLCQTVQ